MCPTPTKTPLEYRHATLQRARSKVRDAANTLRGDGFDALAADLDRLDEAFETSLRTISREMRPQ